jgi:hypothetical protein
MVRFPSVDKSRKLQEMEEEKWVSSPVCFNCGEKLPKGKGYCPACGQKVQARRVPLMDLFHELGEAFFNVDNKIFLTLKALVIPGKLTQLFFEGKRKQFVHPARLFLVTGIVFLAALNYMGLHEVRETFESGEEALLEKAFLRDFRSNVEQEYRDLKEQGAENAAWEAGLDTMMQIVGHPGDDSLNYGYLTYLPDSGFTTRQIRMDRLDMIRMEKDSLFEHYQIQGFVGQTIMQQLVRVTRHPADFWKFAMGQVIWTLLIMMPVIALLMKLIYIRRNRYFIEHLYFNFHTHGFIFLLFTLTMVIPVSYAIRLPVAFGLGAIYVYAAFLRFYGQGWFKTLLKFSFIGLAYQIIIVFFALFTFLISGFTYS